MVAILPQQNLGSLSRRVSSNCFTRHIRGRAGLFLLFPDTPYAIPEDEQRHGVVAPVILSLLESLNGLVNSSN